MRAEDVVLRELEGVAEGVVHVRLRREVHDGVDLLALEHVVHQVRRADVTFHKLVVRQPLEAIQVLQGPYITNTYGGGIQCQGPTLNVTPYVTGAVSMQNPYEPYFDSPVYDMRDIDEDGAPDNPGDILYYVPTRTGQKNNTSLSVGFSATWSNPLDKELQDQCKKAAATQIALQQQLTANKRLDFEIARLKNCGDLMKQGIYFHPKSPFAAICADVVVNNVNTVMPHAHSIPSPSTSESRVSGSAADLGDPLQIRERPFSP